MTRADILQVLDKWRSGLMSAADVHEWAQDIYFPGEVEFEDWEPADDHQGSVSNEVMVLLDNLDMNLLTTEDLPALVSFLHTPKGKFSEAYTRFQEWFKSTDIDSRRKTFVNDPLYEPYCRTPGKGTQHKGTPNQAL